MHTYSLKRFVKIATGTFATTFLPGKKTGKSIMQIQIGHHDYTESNYRQYVNFKGLIKLQILSDMLQLLI